MFENLRMLPHAPGVQMANIPEDGAVLAEDSALADEANADKRNPPQLWDKQITPDNEFEDGKSGNRDESIPVAAGKNGGGGGDAGDGLKEEAMEVDKADEKDDVAKS